MLLVRNLPFVEAALSRWPKAAWGLRHLRFIARAISHRCLLPPGRLDPSDNGPRTDQLFFLKKAKILGPIFKVIYDGGYMTCLVGHARAAEFLRAYEEVLVGPAIGLRGLFPKGHIRAMSDEDHKKYRRLFVQALQATPLSFHEDAIRRWIFDKLNGLENDYIGTAVPGSQLRLCLREIATGIMLRILLGVAPHDAAFPVLVQNYKRFGPNAPVKWIGPEQAESFDDIRGQVQRLADEIRRDPHLAKALG
jgi:cytochrome P450